jgi:hypothetical protein
MAALLFVVPAASAKPKAPGSLLPANAKKLTALPVFTWAPIKNADHYDFQIASDKAFSVAVKADSGTRSTKNTAMTLPSGVPTGTYWWRIRDVTASNVASSWTKARSFSYTFAPITNVLGPDSGTAFTIPPASLAQSLILRWAPMPGAAQYAVTVAHDALMASVVTPGGNPEVIDGTSYTLDGRLTDGTYYWSVTPIDAQGNKGIPSAIRTFSVAWQSSAGVPTMTDIASGDQLLDPLFTWSPVFGASGYEVEVSTSQDFAASSRVSDTTTTATSFSPTTLFQDNEYYWRVRPYDSGNNPGPWTPGAAFTTTFDNVPPLPGPSITGVRMRDMSDIGGTPSTDPVIEWDPVLGASSYQLELDSFVAGACDESLPIAKYNTYTTAWAPMGDSTGQPSFGNSGGPRGEQSPLSSGASYCVKLRAVNTDPGGNVVYGDWTYANNYQSPLFTYSNAAPSTTVAPCNSGLWECSANYVEPANGLVETSTPPVFVWKPVTGALGYYIVISKDPNFANILDYAFTNQPTYTPRDKTYADETSPIYWAVLPTAQQNGTGYPQPSGNIVTLGGKQTFTKQSVPPTVTSLNATGAGVSFQWAPQIGAAYYQLQVSTDPTFSNTLEDVTTDSASYTAAKSYPAGQTLYYRLRTDDAGGNALTWSPTATFTRTLPAPVTVASTGDINPLTLDGVPTWAWSAVSGAVSYDVHVIYPDGTTQDVNGVQPTIMSWDKFDGVGVWRWEVRAEFPTGGGTVPGPYSALQSFTRLFGAPTGRRSVVTKSRVIFSWLTKQGAKQYHLQIGTNTDFSSTVDDVTQDTTSFAPPLTETGFVNGGPLLWRVAAVDAEGNQSPWSPIMRVALAKGLKITGNPAPAKGKAGVVTVTVVDAKGKPVKDVTVRVAGAGTAPRAKRTNKKGIVTLQVRPTSAGSMIFRATKSGYQLATLTDQVS